MVQVSEGLKVGDTVSIPLTQGKVAIIDSVDLALIAPYRWRAVLIGRKTKKWYAATTDLTRSLGKYTVYMHQLIVMPGPGMEVDHINGDGLNNTHDNLREATHTQNNHNKPLPPNRSSSYRGVSRNGKEKQWRARIQYERHTFRLGYYATPEEAARAYDAKAYELLGNFAVLNFAASGLG